MSFTPYSKEDQLNRSGGLHSDELKRYKDKSIKWMKEKARSVCHQYIRERDRDGNHFTCISCGQIKLIKTENGHSNYHAGHFKSAGEYPMLKYDEVNINGQCIQCNHFKSGNVHLYSESIIKKWGRAQYNRINAIASYSNRVGKKWDKIELAEIIKYYSRKLKDIKNADKNQVVSGPSDIEKSKQEDQSN